MADTGATFIKRVVSGLLGVLVITAIGYYGGTRGLEFVCTAAVILAIREFSRMAFRHRQMPPSVTHAYWIICATLYAVLFLFYSFGSLAFAFANITFLVVALWLSRNRVSNENLLPGLTMGCFGLIYCVLLPFFAVKLVRLDEGAQWFLFLLVVVFFGDTFAYFGGRWFGRLKLMPQVSPNKTWEGSASGLVGSSVAGTVILLSNFPEIPWLSTFLFCVVCGAVAQSGDLLMSLVKRVADVKDSGHIMPGHGGILDRLDGIFIACPLVYAFALYVRPL